MTINAQCFHLSLQFSFFYDLLRIFRLIFFYIYNSYIFCQSKFQLFMNLRYSIRQKRTFCRMRLSESKLRQAKPAGEFHIVGLSVQPPP